MIITKIRRLVVFVIVLSATKGDDLKSSLTFVIDDTVSMREEIRQVKDSTDDIFEAVLNSNTTQIDEFIIVTFNDPDIKFRIKTKLKEEFRKALKDIRIGGGGDCPEMAMAGIEEGIHRSKPSSFLYVFTDASAKDSGKYEHVKSLAQKKSIQVTFLLTGMCKRPKEEAYIVYDKLATATSGQVFNIKKDEVTKIVQYILATIKSKKTILAQKSFKDGCGKNFAFTVDSKVRDILVSVSAVNPVYGVIRPKGINTTIKELIHTKNTLILSMEAKPGNYIINIINCGKTTVVVSASTLVSFRHGFSSTKPNSLDETFTKPILDKLGNKSYLAIELDNEDRDIKLEAVELRDIDDNINKTVSLKLIDEKEQFYITESFIPPNITFKIAINGYTDTKEKITRISPTTLEYYVMPPTEDIKPKAPSVNISSTNPLVAEYDESLTLKCKVSGFPEPHIIWEDESHTVWPSTVKQTEPPYEYISILQIEKVTKNITFICKANNSEEGSDIVNVITKRKIYFNVLEYPTDLHVEYGKSVELKCTIEALPPATIIWYKNNEVINTNEDFHVSSDGAILKIENVQSRLGGEYYVEAYNGHERKKYVFNVTVTGTEIPQINKNVIIYTRERGSSVDISCRIIKGKPKPIISWSFDRHSLGKFINLKKTEETIHIHHIDVENVGTYRCNVSNEIGMDFHDMELLVEYPPTIKITPKRYHKAQKGDIVQLTCEVDGAPIPKVRWFLNGTEISDSIKKYRIFRDHTLSFIGTLEDSGNYTCEASNSLDIVRKKVTVFIYEPAKIKPPKQSTFNVKLRKTLTLLCEVEGYPKPKVTWTYIGFGSAQPPASIESNVNNSIVIEDIQLVDEGLYTCLASNVGTLDSITYEVHVPVHPEIKHTLVSNDVHGVEGDPILRLPCAHIGSPTPTITWQINGLNIAFGTGLYEIGHDGTLVINNLTLEDKGTYTCKAKNSVGNDTMSYKVNIHSYPPLPHTSPRLLYNEGTTKTIYCCENVLKETNLVRWFKDGKLIKTNNLTLINITKADAGRYTCRFSTAEESHSCHWEIVVGRVPKFMTVVSPTVTYEDGAEARLDCRATGDPPPETKWWQDKEKIRVKSEIHIIKMTASNIGEYICYVTNEFGTIKRTFDITAGECLMKLESDFTAQQPILVTGKPGRKWPIFEISKGSLQIQKIRKFSLYCPDSFISYDDWSYGESVETTCVGDSMFQLGGESVNISEITCNEPVKSLAMGKKIQCLGHNTQLLCIGFNLHGTVLPVYDVCVDTIKKSVLFVKYGMHRAIADTIPKHIAEFTTDTKYHLDISYEEIYDCRNQQEAISSFTSKKLRFDSCCFIRRQLINPRDMLPGMSQVATYHYLNVVPQWSTCGTENWDEVERRLRLYALGLNKTISITAGSTSVRPDVAPIYLKDKSGRQQEIPQYIWKVIEEQFAVIYINIPGLTALETSSYILCKDMCNTVDWMRSTQWDDVDKGVIYCCNIKDFATAFHYEKIFKL